MGLTHVIPIGHMKGFMSFDWMRDMHQENVGSWSKVVLNAPGPPGGVVVLVVHLVHSNPL